LGARGGGHTRLLDDCHRIGVWPDSVQVSGGGLSTRLPTKCRCGSLPVCNPSGTVTRRGSKGDCPARSSIAHLAVPSVRGEAGERHGSYGNELWEFDEHGLMRRREASINDLAISSEDRRWFGPRPEDERGPDHDMPFQ